ncbi:hypothetical protein [Streptomyces chartreusis]|uniref:hypothetical protein n=1 Tax=Streptomyces chartreusis TaxID=1969 RepID=UPI0033CABDE5
MLNPIDTETVIQRGGAVGVFPGQIHEGVAWWLGACLVVTQKADRIIVAHDSASVLDEFTSRLYKGAINAEHYACNVEALGAGTRDGLVAELQQAGVPGAWLTSWDSDVGTTVHIELFDRAGLPLDETGLADIRRRIAEDRVPIPVNDQAKGRIVYRHDRSKGGRP